MIYLDYSANTPVDPRVLDAFVQTELKYPGNPNSVHEAGLAAEKKMKETTTSIAGMLGVKPSEIIYTSGASESNNLALKGIAHASRHVGRHIISTTLEHSSVGGALTALQNQGYEVDLLSITREGKIDLEDLRDLLRNDTILVALTLVDSELGTIQPIEEVKEILRDYPNCRLHIDATQAVGKMRFSTEGIDTLSLTPHKFYGLNGSGILYKKEKLIIEPQIHGGSSTTLYRSGTPALSLAVALEKALSLADEEYEERYGVVQRHRDDLVAFFSSYQDVVINSPKDGVPHILNLSAGSVKGSVFQKALSDRGICVSVKSACSSDGTPSKAVFAVGRDRKRALSSWRISLSHLTTEEEIKTFCEVFDTCYKELVEGK